MQMIFGIATTGGAFTSQRLSASLPCLMPNYDYVCAKCEQRFEIFQSMKDKALTKCPDKRCGGKIKRQLGTGAGLIFKGSGFYITDYRSDAYKKDAKSEKASSTEATPASPASPATHGKETSAPKESPAPAPPKPETKVKKSAE